MVDLLISGGTLVTATGEVRANLAVDGGEVVMQANEIDEVARELIDARGLHIFPGVIDAHVHFNEPGRAHWEGLRTGSAALAAGGGTLYLDMPLNSVPATLDEASFLEKQRAAEVHSVTDFALWGGLTPDNLGELETLAALGVVGFKAFMSHSGVAEFKAADDLTLLTGMRTAARLGLPVAVHAESQALTAALTKQIRAQGGKGVREYGRSRPVVSELEAISRALLFAEETGCDLHVVHVSSARGVGLVQRARERGVRATCETCPHYLLFDEEDAERLGAVLKCAPPLRSKTEQDALWRCVVAGGVDFIASDHSPSDPALKEREDFFEVWGGVASVQTTLAALLTTGPARGLDLARIASLTAARPAARFRLAGKGGLEPGCDADLSLVELDAVWHLTPEQLHTRHALSPYLGQRFRGRVRRTLCRGQTVYQDGTLTAKRHPRLVRPAAERTLS